jgi:hypothetical protein
VKELLSQQQTVPLVQVGAVGMLLFATALSVVPVEHNFWFKIQLPSSVVLVKS